MRPLVLAIFLVGGIARSGFAACTANMTQFGTVSFAMMPTLAEAADTGETKRRYALYTPELSLMTETTTSAAANPATAYEYVWFGGEPLAQIETANGTIHWYFNDHIGAPVLTTDSTGSVDWRVEREPYGARYARVGADRHQPLGLPGQELVEATRQYNIFRWYRSEWSRYTQSDPFGIEADFNEYRYAADSPLRYVDPDGLRVQLWCHPVGAGGPLFSLHRYIGAQTKAQHCFLRITCEGCPKYDLKIELTGGNRGQGSFHVVPPTFLYQGNPASIVTIIPSDNDDKDCKNEECIRRHYENYKKIGYPYGGYVSGPNSSTFVADLLHGCGFSVPAWPPGTTGLSSSGSQQAPSPGRRR